MNRGGYGGSRPFQPHAQQHYAPRFSSNTPRQPVEPAGKVVAFDQCLGEKITPASDNQQLLVNSYDLQRPRRDVFQYELKFIAEYGPKQTGELKEEDLSDIPTRHVLASVRRKCLTRLYELLFLQHGDYFEAKRFNKNGKYEHVYVYDRAVKFYCSLDMQDRDKSNPFIIDIVSFVHC
uniref:Uncharacterized protein n=1 Tax=Panagrolaimus sp. PS1159 TaxID=55785 RepID=A0AC35GQN8_9BILA